MIEAIKIAGMSAVLAAGFVVGSGAGQPSVDTAKKYTDRVPEAATQIVEASLAGRIRAEKPSCGAQTWPYLSAECMSAADATPRKAVRTVTVEQREGTNVSLLVRLPVAAVASR